MGNVRRLPVRTGAAVAATAVVVTLRPQPARWSRTVDHLDVDALARVLAGGALWLLAVWALLALGLGRLAALPGAAGRLGHRLVGVCVPRVARGIVLGGVAGGLLLGPAVAAAAAPVWPTSPPAAVVTTPGPAWPTSPAPRSTPPVAPPTTPTPTGPAPTVPPAGPPPSPTPSPTGGAAAAVVVAPGDSLWSITARALADDGTPPLDARVAATWPTWYAANRAVIGPDPGLLHPGTHLTPPDGSPR